MESIEDDLLSTKHNARNERQVWTRGVIINLIWNDPVIITLDDNQFPCDVDHFIRKGLEYGVHASITEWCDKTLRLSIHDCEK